MYNGIFIPNFNNYNFYDNPIIPGDVLWWGYGYPREIFYEIDFENILLGKYVISSYGRVFSRFTGRQLKTPKRSKDNHLVVGLKRNDGSSKSFLVHRLVAFAFIFKTEEDIHMKRDYVNHKNLIQWDNTVWNLEWCTPWENDNHARENNAYGKLSLFTTIEKRSKIGSLGSNNGHAQLTEEQVHNICQCLEAGYNNEQICETVGIEYNRNNIIKISQIKGRRNWLHISSQYNIPYTKSVVNLTEPYVRQICELLQQGMSTNDIYNTLQLPLNKSENDIKDYIIHIKKRYIHSNISKDYNF